MLPAMPANPVPSTGRDALCQSPGTGTVTAFNLSVCTERTYCKATSLTPSPSAQMPRACALTDKITPFLSGKGLDKAALSLGSLRSLPGAAQKGQTTLQPGQTKPGHLCQWNLLQGKIYQEGKKKKEKAN